MAGKSLTLVNSGPVGGPGIELSRKNGITVNKFDPGWPEVRSAVDMVPGAHGTRDFTEFFGARTITIDMQIWGGWCDWQYSRREIMDKLKALCNPAVRPYLVENIDGQDERRILLRGDTGSMPFELPHTNKVQLSFVAPEGYWESNTEIVDVMWASQAEDLGAGRTYPRNFDYQYPATTPYGTSETYNNGNLPTPPVLRVHGPFDSFEIGLLNTGKKIVCPDYILGAGQWVEIDMRNRTFLEAGVTKFEKVDWSQSEWWEMLPGVNQLNFEPTNYTEQTKLEVAYRYAWM